jgi:hypothetical protein
MLLCNDIQAPMLYQQRFQCNFNAASSSLHPPQLFLNSDTICCIFQMRKHKTNIRQPIQMQTKNTTIYVVHPNVGLRPPRIDINYLIIQLMEITVKSHSSLTDTASTGIHRIYSNVHIKCNLIHILSYSHWLKPTPVYRI